ncbi:MAG: 50S ribosomal protein L11 methyltransferase [Deltaproteobacteria bacterium]|nr:50S ribosomal protein L11 methyltransferase [Deltaproteobacteria bacterium]
MLEHVKEVGPDFFSLIKTIKRELLEVVQNKPEKITPGELEKTISQKFSIKRMEIRSVIKDLIAEKALTYTYHYGRTFIEQSFNKAVRISKHVILKPPEVFFKPEPDDVVVELAHGASFGTGQHPTTRMAIKGIEHVIKENDLLEGNKETCALDIGTGSGVLAITAVRLGCNKAVGLDIDPCARYEARENVKINGLKDKVGIYDSSLEDFNEKFTLITANLRYPTLKKLYSAIATLTEQEGAVVLSGIKTDEVAALIDIYKEKYFECTWKESENDWAGLVFLKTAKKA